MTHDDHPTDEDWRELRKVLDLGPLTTERERIRAAIKLIPRLLNRGPATGHSDRVLSPVAGRCADIVLDAHHNLPGGWASAHGTDEAASMRADAARGIAAVLRHLAASSSPGDAITLHMWADDIWPEET